MGKTCSPVYYDTDGKLSKAYYDNLRLGEDVAQREYLRAMAPLLNTRFQQGAVDNKAANWDDFVKQARTHQGVDNDWTVKPKEWKAVNQGQKSPSQMVSKDFPDSKFEEILLNRKRREIVLEIFDTDTELRNKYYEKYKADPARLHDKSTYWKLENDFAPEFIELINKRADDFYTANPTVMGKQVKEFRKENDAVRDGGTKIHHMIEEYLKQRTEWIANNEGKTLDPTAIITETFIQGGKDFGKKDHDEFKPFLEEIEQFLLGINFGKSFNYEVELPLVSDRLGMRGTADLVVQDENGFIHVFDWKTKRRNAAGSSKVDLFNTQAFGRVNDGKGPFGNLYQNAKTSAEVQTSIYKLILEETFGENKVATANVVYIDTDLDSKNNVTNPKINRTINLQARRSNLVNYFKGLNNPIDINKHLNTSAVKEIRGVIQNLSGVANFDEFSDPDKFYRQQIRRYISDPDKFIDNLGRNYFVVDGKTHYWETFGNEESMYLQLSEQYQSMGNLVNETAEKFIKYFNDGQWSGMGENILKVSTLLTGVTPETHTLERVKELPGMEQTGDDVIVAINKLDRSSKIFSISTKAPAELEANKDSKWMAKRTSVFHKHFSDAVLKSAKYDLDELLNNEEPMHRSLELALVGMQLKKMDYIDSIDTFSVGVINKSKKRIKPVSHSMQSMLPHLEVLRDIVSDKKKFPSGVDNLVKNLNDPILMNPSTYQVGAVQYLSRLLTDKLHQDLSYVTQDQNEKVTETLAAYGRGEATNKELISELISMTQMIAKSITSKDGTEVTKKDLLRNEEYIALSRATLSLMEFEFNIKFNRKELTAMNNFQTMGRVPDEAVQFMSAKIFNTETLIKKDVSKFKTQHTKVMADLQAEAEVTYLQRGLKMDTGAHFKEMFVHDDPHSLEEKQKHPDGSYMLKDASDTSLKPAQVAYINFFNNKMEETMRLSLGERDFKTVLRKGIWKKGMVPLMKQSTKTKRNDIKTSWEKMKSVYQYAVERGSKLQEREHNFDDLLLSMSGAFDYQFETSSLETRNDKLNIVDRGDGIVEAAQTDPFETNLEVILNHFVRDTYQKVHYKETIGTYHAMSAMLGLENLYNHVDNKDTQEFLDGMVKLIVFNEHKREGKWAKGLDKANKMVSFGALAFSPKQFLLEFSTMGISSISGSLAQFMRGKNAKFTGAGYASSMLMVMGDAGGKGKLGRLRVNNDTLTGAIINSFGLFSTDSEGLARDEHAMSRKDSLFQSRHGYSFLLMPHKAVTTATFIAMMKRDGVLPAISAKDGNTVYDVSLDERFAILFNNKKELKKSLLDSNGKLKDNVTKAEKEAYLLLDYNRKTMRAQGLVDENDMPTEPYTDQVLEGMKDHLMHVYGTLDKRGKLLSAATAFGRLFSKFKTWVAPKFENYWATRAPSLARGELKTKLDADGKEYVVFEPGMNEGILQTLMHLSRGIYEMSTDKDYTMKTWKTLDEGRRENLARLSADIITFSVLSMLFGQLFDDDDEDSVWRTPGGKMFKQVMENSLSDVAIWQILESTSTGSPAVAISYMQKLAVNGYQFLAITATGDVETGLSYAKKTTGVTKSLDFADWSND